MVSIVCVCRHLIMFVRAYVFWCTYTRMCTRTRFQTHKLSVAILIDAFGRCGPITIVNAKEVGTGQVAVSVCLDRQDAAARRVRR